MLLHIFIQRIWMLYDPCEKKSLLSDVVRLEGKYQFQYLLRCVYNNILTTASYNSNTNAWQDLRSQYLNSDNATFSVIGWYNFSGLQFDWFSAFGCDVAPFTSIISNFLPSNSRKINLFRYDAFYFFKSRDPLSESPPGQSICLKKHSQWEFGTINMEFSGSDLACLSCLHM